MSGEQLPLYCPLCGNDRYIEESGTSRPCPECSTPPAALSDPTTDRLGAFHGPAAGAPETERRAAILITPRSGTARRRVLEFIADRGDRGATDEEAALALAMRLYTAAPRRNELLRDGWIEDSGLRRATTTGSAAAVWRLTDRGRAEWPAVRTQT